MPRQKTIRKQNLRPKSSLRYETSPRIQVYQAGLQKQYQGATGIVNGDVNEVDEYKHFWSEFECIKPKKKKCGVFCFPSAAWSTAASHCCILLLLVM